MSASTLQAIEDAILAHHRDTTDAAEQPERFGAVITGWVVGYESSNIVDVGEQYGGHVIGFANSYITSDCSPNLHVGVARWTAAQIATDGTPPDGDDN